MSLRPKINVKHLSFHSFIVTNGSYRFLKFDVCIFLFKAFAQSEYDIVYTVFILIFVKFLVFAIF